MILIAEQSLKLIIDDAIFWTHIESFEVFSSRLRPAESRQKINPSDFVVWQS
jgi:hypothetical protein